MSIKLQNISNPKNNPLVKLSIWGIKVVYRKYIKILKAKRNFKKKKITICSFHPTCSEYGILALRKYGFFIGWIKTINRITRCNTYQHIGSCVDYP